MFIFWYVLKLIGCFRVNAADEAAGLDASHHGGSAYPVDLDDDASHKGSSYNGNQSGYNKVSSLESHTLLVCHTEIAVALLFSIHGGNMLCCAYDLCSSAI